MIKFVNFPFKLHVYNVNCNFEPSCPSVGRLVGWLVYENVLKRADSYTPMLLSQHCFHLGFSVVLLTATAEAGQVQLDVG